MPYIEERRRDLIDEELVPASAVLVYHGSTPGDLNYAVTLLVTDYLGFVPNYERFNAAIGVLECAKLELYRRMIAPYEDEKMHQNGDVY